MNSVATMTVTAGPENDVLWRRLAASMSLIVLVPAEEPPVLQATNRSLGCFGLDGTPLARAFAKRAPGH